MENEPAKILVIEDEVEVRRSYLDMFGFFGYDVKAVSNGHDGVKLLNEQDFDIVVTDLNMPGMDGLEVLKYIKKNKPYIEVIVITGYATLENAIKAMKVGAYDYFTKPVDIDHVRILLSKCVKQIRAKRENEELKSLNQQLREINEMKDKFITITNHELRTPITVLKGYVELIDYFLEDAKNKDISEALGIINSTMSELISIVEQMHDMSSINYGKKKFLSTDIHVQDLLQSIYREMKLLFERRNLDFQLQFNGPPVIVHGDFHRLKRSIRELMTNALKFTPENGSVTISYSVNQTNQNVFIKVSDTGIGIPADKQTLVFEPFYEVQDAINHMTSKTEFMGGGIGLGLTLAKEIFESHRGSILLESEEKKGSIFTVVLPYTRLVEAEIVQ